MTTTRIHLDGWKWASLALIPFALILIVLFTVLDIRIATEPPFLLTILNTVFIGIIPLVIAAIALRSYRSSGSASLFMMGSGMMIFGLGSIAAGWLIGLPGGANISIAIYNVSIFLSAVFYLAGALLTIIQRSTPKTTGSLWKIAAVTGGIIFFEAAFIVLTIAGSIPPFFIAGSGPTVLRQVILSNAIVILAIASILLFHVYRQKREDFFFWYSVSLAVIAIGLVGALFTPALGSPVNWVSRVMQYVGAGFALVAIIVAGRLARDRGLSLEETLSRFFSDAEAGYKSLVETATDAIVVVDAADRVIIWNRAAEKMFGYSGTEAVGSNFTELLVPDESAGVIENIFRSSGSSGAGSADRLPVEITVRRKDGITFPAEMTVSRHMTGGLGVSSCIIRDLTDRKRAEAQIMESYKTFSDLIEGAPFGIYIIDSQFRIAMMNTGSQNNAFRNVRPLIGRNFSEAMHTLWPDEVAEEILGHFRHTLETGKPYYSPRFTNPRHDIELVESYEWELHRMTLPDGQFGVICYYFDSTELRNAEEALRHSEERLRLAEEAGNVGVWDWDMQTGEVRWTPELEAIYGLKPGSVHTYQDFRDRVHPDDIERVEKIQSAAVDQHKPFEYEFRFRRPDGEAGWVYCRGGALYDQDGRPVRQFGVNIDVTDRKRAEEELHEREAELSFILHLSDALRQLEDPVQVQETSARLLGELLGADRVFYGEIVVEDGIEIMVIGRDYHRPGVTSLTGRFPFKKFSHSDYENYRTGRTVSSTNVFTDGREPGQSEAYRAADTAAFIGVPLVKQGKLISVLGILQRQPRNWTPGEIRLAEHTIDRTWQAIQRAQAEEALLKKNVDLNALNEELKAREKALSHALAEKEVLLSEVHHRVKNNLTAFISLLSLEGSTEETSAGLELKKDLQNRARSMALIHETLYKTHQYSSVDMETYLTPLIDQIINSYSSPQSIKIIVEAKDVSLDLARATPIGLIVNELVTNSLKHAFPHEGKECRAGQNDPCTIGVRLTKEDGSYLMSVYDNGVGLPAGFDPLTAKTLGLKLVTFLAKHQVRARIEVKTEKGTEFVLRFKE
jgi:PAS domain S-box-containing protein